MLDVRPRRDHDVGHVARCEQAVADHARVGVQAEGERLRIVELAGPVGDDPAVRARWAFARDRVAQALQRAREPEREQLERDGRREARDRLLVRGDDDEPRRAAATSFSRVWARPPPLISHGPGAIWSAPSIAMSSSGSVSKASTINPAASAASAVASEVATQRIRSARAASAGINGATVDPVPRPTRIPSSTRPAAYVAAACFSSSAVTRPGLHHRTYAVKRNDGTASRTTVSG